MACNGTGPFCKTVEIVGTIAVISALLSFFVVLIFGKGK